MLFHVYNPTTKETLAIHSSHAGAKHEASYHPGFEVRAACSWCDRINVNDPSDYYHAADCESRFLHECITRETDPEAIRKLKIRLERAQYTGD